MTQIMAPQTEGLITHWYVRVKFKYKLGWDYSLCKTHPPFPSRQAAEKYAAGLFGVEEWDIKELTVTMEEAQKMERVRQIMAHWKAVYDKAPETIQ